MSTITREQLRERAREKVKSLEFAVTQAAFADSRAELEEELELARIALASLEAEPVAYMHRSGQIVTREECCDDKTFAICCKVETPLFTSPPAPVSVPNNKSITQHFDTIALETAREIMCDVNRRQEFLGGDVQLLSRIQCRIDDACRASMLQDADGNSSVIPDGWVACSERLPPEGYEPDGGAVCYLVWHKNEVDCGPQYSISNVFFLRKHWERNFTHWMPLPAAPQHEVKQ